MTALDSIDSLAGTGGGRRVALVHDFLVTRGGAERVALAMARAFPDATLHTALHDPAATFEGFGDHRVEPLAIDRLRPLRRNHRWSLPLLHAAFSRRVIDADVVLCSSSGFSHLVSTTGHKIVYCHTPARWLHDQDRYLDRFGPVPRAAARWMTRGALRRDGHSMLGAARIIANSNAIREQVADLYGRAAQVIAPCSSLALAGPSRPIDGVAAGFVFCPSRALGYKRLDVLLEAAARLPNHTFVQVGEGPDLTRLRRSAPPNVLLAGEVSDAQMRWAYEHAALVVLTSAEDFGLVPIEARAHGLVSVVPRARGFLDHVVEGDGGRFYEFGDAAGLADAVVGTFGARVRVPQDDPLGERRFAAALRRVVDEVVGG